MYDLVRSCITKRRSLDGFQKLEALFAVALTGTLLLSPIVHTSTPNGWQASAYLHELSTQRQKKGLHVK